MNRMTGIELILGGQRSGKSRQAEQVAMQWLQASPDARVVFVATATAHDAEMRERIERHRMDRAERMAGVHTVEEPLALGGALRAYSSPSTLVLVDCLTLWLTNGLMPVNPEAMSEAVWEHERKALLHALAEATGPVVLVSNEIGLGVVPMGRETRRFVDELGRLNQDVAQISDRVTMMVAGLPMVVKRGNA